MLRFLRELKERKVFQAAAAYVVFAWVVAQVASLVLESFEAPAWIIKAVLLLLAAGFPLALFLAWAYELTADGIRPTHGEQSQGPVQKPARLIGMGLITLAMVTGFSYFGWRLFIQTHTEVDTNVRTEASGPPDKSIAILPFDVLSADASNRYLADGLAETLLHKLAQISDLKVIAKNSSFQYRGGHHDVRDIGSALDVGVVLEGSVQESGQRLRIIATLIDTRDGSEILSQQFDDSTDNIFALQDRIATAIVTELELSMSSAERDRVLRNGTDSRRAYDLLIHAEAARNDYTVDDLARVSDDQYAPIALVRQALELDPDYAHAWSDLASYYGTLAFMAMSTDTHARYVGLAEQAAREALRLDPELDSAHAQLGFVSIRLSRFDEAARHFRTALDLNGNYSAAAAGLGLVLLDEDPEESLRLFTHAQRLDPEYPTVYRQKHFALSRLGRFDEARQQLELAIERNPEEGFHYVDMANLYLYHYLRPDEAARWISKAMTRASASAWGAYGIAETWLAAGDADRAEAWGKVLLSDDRDNALGRDIQIRSLLSAGAFERALSLLDGWALESDGSGDLYIGDDARIYRAISCLKIAQHECARQSVRALREATTIAIAQGEEDHDGPVLTALLQEIVNFEATGAYVPSEELGALLVTVKQWPLTSNTTQPARGYKEAAILGLLGRDAEAIEALDQILGLSDTGFIAFDFTGLPPSESLLLASLGKSPGFADWVSRFERRRSAMLETMLSLEASGEIITPAESTVMDSG